jgi:SAM-dependent methyltransferase
MTEMRSVGLVEVIRQGLHRALLGRAVRDALGSVGHARRALDLGCGDGPYRDALRARCELVVGCDVRPRVAGPVVGASADRLPFRSGAFDVVLATQVLEHVSRPEAVAAEAARVLADGGWLVVSVPQMVALHEAPYDFFRYTVFGLEHVLRSAGLERVVVRPLGGFWWMIAQQLEFKLLWDRGATWRWARRLELAAGRLLLRALAALDGRRPDERYALNLVATARKPPAGGAR